MAAKEVKFETAMERLEEIVKRLEDGDMPLEESLRLFEEGVKLSRVCDERLKSAERRIEILLKDDQGKVAVLPFDAQSGSPAERDDD